MPRQKVETAEPVKEEKAKSGGKLRKMTDKEKAVFAKHTGDMDKSQKARLRMKVLRSPSPVETAAKLKKLM